MLYALLLHDPGVRERWGLYVGRTTRDPNWRFDQHNSGYRASGAVRRFGTRLIPDFYEHLNPVQRWKSLEIEAALADALRAVGVGWVEGSH